MVSKIVGCKPVGSQVLVEHLTDNEMLDTKLLLPEGTSQSAEVQQSIVVAVGPGFIEKSWGFGPGDRVMVVGSYNPVPPYDDGSSREKGIIEPHNVRAVLLEEGSE